MTKNSDEDLNSVGDYNPASLIILRRYAGKYDT